MTKTSAVITIKRELKKINARIDQKILKGIPYNREARMHKALMAQISRFNRSGWLNRAMATFLF